MPAQNDPYFEIHLSIIIGIIVFLVISGLMILILLFYQKKRFQHQQQITEMEKQYREELLQSQLETQEYSFNQISQELHDNIGQLLSSTKLLLGIASMEMETVPDTIKTAEQTVGKAIQDLRLL